MVKQTVPVEGTRFATVLSQEAYMKNFLKGLSPEWMPKTALTTTGVYEATDTCRDCGVWYRSARHLRDYDTRSSFHEIRFSEADIVDWPVLR